MDLGKAGWLEWVLSEVVQGHRAPSPAYEATRHLTGRARARAYLRQRLRETGLLYGTPTSQAGQTRPQPGAPEELLFIAVIQQLSAIALDIAELVGAEKKSASESLLLLFAFLTGLLDEAEQIQRCIRPPGNLVPRRIWSRVELALSERSLSLGGDPVYGLVLHNGAVYVDAQVFGRQAIDYFWRGDFSVLSAQRRLEFAARQKVVLVEVLTALACAERPPSFPARRAILRQIEDLKLPASREAELRDYVKAAFDRRPGLSALVKGVRSRDMRRFILEQTLLASVVDGRRSASELAFIQELALALGFSSEALRQIEMEVAEFYAKNRSVVDVFTISAGAGMMGQEVVERIQRTVEKNFHRLMKEIRETGELSVLMTKAARGQKLTKEERAKMRAQLIDVAKAIPALAIFAAPGGILLFIALAKVLPFNLLPSSFQEGEDETGESKISSEKKGA